MLLGRTHRKSGRKGQSTSRQGGYDPNRHTLTLALEDRCILMNMIVPKLEYAGDICEGNAKLVKQLEIVQMTAAKEY